MSLATRVIGSGPPALLVHAGGVDGRMWAPLASLLAGYHTLLIPDLRGHGRTPASEAPFDHVADLLQVLDEHGIEQVPVVGASFGGGLAICLAGLASERVSRLGLLAATLFDHKMGDAVERFWEQEDDFLKQRDVEGAVELGVRMWVRDLATAELVRAMSRDAFSMQLEAPDVELDPVQDLGAVVCPVLAVSGGLDQPVFGQMADRICAEVSGPSQRAVVEDSGHLIALERPDRTARILAAFLA